MAALHSFGRVMFAELLPPGREAEFFALYSITDKGSSWLGPLVVGFIGDLTHNMRYSFVFLLIFMAIPVVIVWFINVNKGREEAKDFARRHLVH